MLSKKELKRKVLYTLGTGMLACTFAFAPVLSPAPVAHADMNTWNKVFEAIGNATMLKYQYDEAKSQIINMSNIPSEQDKTLRENVAKKGLDSNVEHNERVTRVLNNLIEKGNYVRKTNQLPFRWRVVNSKDWNASCYANNYIAVNSGLVEDLTNDDALAMVLSHEMIHGLHQHIANDSAKQLLYQYGASLFTKNTDYIKQTIGAFLSNYVTVKNTTNVSEGDADNSGFYLFTSAGYNPGGAPIEAIHMVAVTGGGRSAIADFFAPNNHPDSATRFKRLEKQMEEYGYNHAKVKDGKDVFVDDKYLLTANDSVELKDYENAYLIAGGIAKGLHDKKTFYEWHFDDATQDFLDDTNAYSELKKAIKENNLYATFQTMIQGAYHLDISDKDSRQAKAKLIKEEKERNAKIEKERQAIVDNKAGSKANYNEHFEQYTKLGLHKLALQEIKQSYDLEPDYIASGNLARAYCHMNLAEIEKNGQYNPGLAQQSVSYGEEALAKAPDNDKEWLIKNLAIYYYQAKNPTKIDEMANMLEVVAPKNNAGNISKMHGKASFLRGDIDKAVSQLTAFVNSGGNISDIDDVSEEVFEKVKANSKTAEQIYSANE